MCSKEAAIQYAAGQADPHRIATQCITCCVAVMTNTSCSAGKRSPGGLFRQQHPHIQVLLWISTTNVTFRVSLLAALRASHDSIYTQRNRLILAVRGKLLHSTGVQYSIAGPRAPKNLRQHHGRLTRPTMCLDDDCAACLCEHCGSRQSEAARKAGGPDSSSCSKYRWHWLSQGRAPSLVFG